MSHKTGKKYSAAFNQVERKPYALEEAVPLVKKIKFAKFDETVELHMRLGVDPKHADQMVRGTVVLPNGLGKSKTVLVIASGDKLKEASEAGEARLAHQRVRAIAAPSQVRLVGRQSRRRGLEFLEQVRQRSIPEALERRVSFSHGSRSTAIGCVVSVQSDRDLHHDGASHDP